MKRIPDSSLRLEFWPSDTCVRVCGAQPIRRWPSDLGGGIPICPECGEDYYYHHTVIKEHVVTVHVRGGVAYAPEKSFNGVKVKVRDHDD